MKLLEDFYQESPTKAKTRLEIVTSASKRFSDKGIDVITMTDIAADCNITLRNLYRYYASKEYLVVDAAYHLFYQVTRLQEHGTLPLQTGIEQLEHLLNRTYAMDKSKIAGLSMMKFVMYFDLYLSNMATDHPAFLKYTKDYVPHIQELGRVGIEEALKQGIQDGTIELELSEVDMNAEYIMQSLFSVIMRTLIKESENEAINAELVYKHIDVLITYYRR